MSNPLPQAIRTRGIQNARELGGYETASGTHVVHKRLLRTGCLRDAAPGDLDILARDYDVRLVMDFRTAVEAAKAPDPALPFGYLRIPVISEDDPADSTAAIVGIYLGHENAVQGLVDLATQGHTFESIYTDLIVKPHMMSAFRTFFQQVLATPEGAVLWHCNGGKDRTGIAAVLMLTALGVPRETCLADFELTNRYRAAKIEYLVGEAQRYTSDPEALARVRDLAGVNRRAMEKVFDLADEEFGGLSAYLQHGIGLTTGDIAELRARYTE